MNKTMILALVLAAGAAQAATVVSDDFSVIENLGSYVTSGPIGLSDWNVTRAGDDWAAKIDGNVLELSNDMGRSANLDGWVFAGLTLSSTNGFNTTLGSSSGLLTWSFNMRQIRTNPAGFGANSYGVAFVLGSSSDNVRSNGYGYAVVLGNTGTPDPIRLVSFTGGLSSLGTAAGGLIVSGLGMPLDNPTNRYMSVQVTYNPADNLWSMYGRDDGASSFTDPLSGSLSFIGSATDSTFTGSDLTYMGAYWQGSTTATQTAAFDNVVLSAIPEPASFGLLALGAIGARLLRRRF
jgi:hypothetical protein